MTRHGPVVAALAVLGIAVAVTLASSLARTDRHFVYALDDTYIHMVVAENVAQTGVWGIDGRTFASCSSSPLWTSLLAAIAFAAGAHAAVPMLLTLVFAAGVLLVADAALRSCAIPRGTRLAALLALTLATPLVTLVFVANEHAMHAFFSLALVSVLAGTVASEGSRPGRSVVVLVLAALTVASRYEGLFLVAVVAALLAARRLWARALSTALGGALPVTAFGLWSMAHGASFLPSSVLMKAKYPWLDLRGQVLAYLGPSLISEALKTPVLAVLVAGAAAILAFRVWRTRCPWEPANLWLIVFVAVALLHMDFARTGEFYRYEAYLVALGIVALGLAAVPARPPVLAIAGIVAVALSIRAIAALRDTPVATGNIFEQQFQTAAFLRDHYGGAAIAVNDIGLVNHAADIRCVDLWGLANAEVAAARRARRYAPATMRAVAANAGADVAIVFDRWFERFGGLPDDWIRVGAWTIPDNVACGSPTVSFYATNAGARDRLAESLRAFSARLPARVRTSGAYLEEP